MHRIVGLSFSRLLATLLAAVWPANAFAGPPQTREGFWLSFGLGYGSARVECDQCTPGSREASVAGWFRLGGTISDHVLLGWEVNGWLKNDKGRLQSSEDLTRTLGNGAVVAVIYPDAASGLFVKVGAGLSYAGLPPRSKTLCLDLGCLGAMDEGAHGNGFGMTAGVGYDFRIRTNLSITADFTYTRGSPGELRATGHPTVVTGWQHDILAIGAGLTFH